MMTLLTAIVLMAVLGLALGMVIGWFAKLFRVESDARVELVTELLPGANCGGCGKAGCSDFAKSVVAGENPPSKCPVSSKEQVSAIAMALGIDAGESFQQRAVVCCGGDMEQTVRLANYNGVLDCVSASLVAGGPKGCEYGCLGMGSCARKCPFGAIEIINNLAVIHRELCVGCGNCVAACPRGVIKLVPADAEVHVYWQVRPLCAGEVHRQRLPRGGQLRCPSAAGCRGRSGDRLPHRLSADRRGAPQDRTERA